MLRSSKNLSTMRLCSLHHSTSLTSLVVCNDTTPYKVIPFDGVHIRVTTVSTIRGTSGCQTNTVTKLQFSTAMDIIEFYWTLGTPQIVDSDVPSDTDGVLRYTSTLC